MRIRWLTGAIRSMRTAHRYVAAENPEAAAKVVACVESAVERLAKHPSSGRTGRRPGTRELVVPGIPFVIIYRVDDAEVVILRVYHTSRNWQILV